ncbi:MAG: GDSL-type esterase/lipase family protein [Caldilineaceae bacterium]
MRISFLITAICGFLLFTTTSFFVSTGNRAASLPAASQSSRAYDYAIGTPTVTDLWVDPVNGQDGASGVDRAHALRSLNDAWQRIPSGATLTNTGYRIQLVAGDYPESSFPEYWEDRHGTAQFPIMLQAADGPRTARLLADLNLANVSYFYILDLTIQHGSDVVHCERCDHLLLRNNALIGSRAASHENLKINQSQYIYLEENDINGAEQNAIDFVAVQYGHILRNHIHNADDWCMYLKGGSAYFLIEANEIDTCGTGGFTAGEGSGFEYMITPWLHYEAYDLKLINNLIHDTEGAGLGVSGSYNILFAYNTLYRVGQRSHVLEFLFGGRTCDGDATLTGHCEQNLSAGGWGTTTVGGGAESIPNRNIYVYNNLIYNPAGYQSQWQQLSIAAPHSPGANSNIANPALADANLVLRGNLIWNGPANHPLGVGDDSGCQASNPTCNPTQLLADNAINTVEPQLRNPAHGDFRPTANSNLAMVTTYALPDFPTWASFTPTVPSGVLSNTITVDRAGVARTQTSLPGAYTAGAPSDSTPAGNATSQVYLPAISNALASNQTATPTPTTQPPTTPTPTATVSPSATPTNTTHLPAGPVTMVMLGDSLTIGQGDDSPEGGGYPYRLWQRVEPLRSNSVFTNLGASGWTSTDLIQGIEGVPSQLSDAVSALNNSSGAKVAFLWVGSNDLWYLYEYNDPSTADEAADLQHYSANLDTLLSQLGATGATLMVALLDDQSQRPVIANPPNPNEPAFPGTSEAERQRMSQQVSAYNDVIRAKAEQYNAHLVDFYHTTIFTTTATLAEDGNHPNAAGYEEVTKKWFAVLEPLLQ